jgi:hypothetical protein
MVNMKIMVICDMMLHCLVEWYQHFRGIQCLHLVGTRVSSVVHSLPPPLGPNSKLLPASCWWLLMHVYLYMVIDTSYSLRSSRCLSKTLATLPTFRQCKDSTAEYTMNHHESIKSLKYLFFKCTAYFFLCPVERAAVRFIRKVTWNYITLIFMHNVFLVQVFR